MTRFWIGVASREHVLLGIQAGICQFCHGKVSTVKRLSQDDYIIYYSSKNMDEKYQKFTAIGQVTDVHAYQFDMSNDFKPYRRNVSYLPSQEVHIKDIIEQLGFIKNKASWGYIFRYGFFEIDRESFLVIARQMLTYELVLEMV